MSVLIDLPQLKKLKLNKVDCYEYSRIIRS
jgi:hypothetical protein